MHRDIKPANVMVDVAGQAKVADFGLARLVDLAPEAPGHTVMGTPDYMAPEQTHGMHVDHRADIYSVGVMLYEMLCRETPQGAFDLPSRRVGCDARIDKIVLKAMQQAPDRRYQSTQEMRAEMATVLVAPAIGAQRTPGSTQPLTTSQPTSRGFPIFSLSFAALAAFAGWLIYQRTQPPEVVAPPVSTAQASPAPRPSSPVAGVPSPTPGKPSATAPPKPVAAASVAPATPKPATPAAEPTAAPKLAQSATAKWIAEQQPIWQAAFANEVTEPYHKSAESLRKQYLATLETQIATFAKAAMLEDAVAFRSERDRFKASGEVPETDSETMHAALKALRANYRAALAKIDQERTTQAKAVHARFDAIMAQSQTALTQRQRLDEAVEMKTARDALSAAWVKPVAGSAAIPPPPPAPEPEPTPVLAKAAATPAAPLASGGTLKDGFVNSLGMRFVKVPGTEVLFCVHETRRQDYAAYAAEVSGVDGKWRNEQWNGIPIGREDIHPVVDVSWSDAQAWCAWLSRKEGKTYRLPTDEEWSFAVGIGRMERRTKGTTPEMLHDKLTTEFPWGGPFPPRRKDRDGNYTDTAYHEKFPTERWIEGYTDGFATTAPVMSFKPNKLGLYDMGGNVREWVEDWWNGTQQERVQRGAGWRDSGPAGYFRSSSRFHYGAAERGNCGGFRAVVEIHVPTPIEPPLSAAAPAPPPASILLAKATPAPPPSKLAPAPAATGWSEWQRLYTEEEWTKAVPNGRAVADGRLHLHSQLMLKAQPSADGALRARIYWQEGSSQVALNARVGADNARYKLSLNKDGVIHLVVFPPGRNVPSVSLGSYTPPKRPAPGDIVLLELRLQGDKLTGLVNGQVGIEAHDARAPGPGQWGILADQGWFESAEVQIGPATGRRA